VENKTDIVIVNWNSGDFLYKCIKSIFTPDNEPPLGRVIIMDNHSTDGSLEIIAPHPKIEIRRNPVNLGFARACNEGFRLSNAAYVLLLNPDTQLLPGCLTGCAQFMDRHPEIDILGCRLLDDQGKTTPTCSRFPKPSGFLSDALGLSKIAPRLFKPAIMMTYWDHRDSRKVDQVMGAFMFIRRPVFDRIGYFDERFFVYYEELDFSRRLAEAGGTSFFNSDITAIHSGGGTTAKVKAFRLFLNLRSRLQYARKHFSATGYATVWFSTYCIEPFSRMLLLLFRGNLTEIRQLFAGYSLLLKNRIVS